MTSDNGEEPPFMRDSAPIVLRSETSLGFLCEAWVQFFRESVSENKFQGLPSRYEKSAMIIICKKPHERIGNRFKRVPHN